jgi:trimeric autotransporter adhesin
MHACLQRSKAAIALLLLSALIGCSNRNGPPQPMPNPSPAPSPSPSPTAGDTLALTSANRLITFNRSSPALRTAVNISGLQTGETLVGLDIRPGGTPAGDVYALASSGRLYIVNASTGAATLKATLSADPTDSSNPFNALDGTDFGVDFNPVPDRLRVVSNTGQNLRINVDTGATITDGALNSSGAARIGVTGVAYTNSFASACRTTLYYLDATTDRLLTTSDPNNGAVSEIGGLGIDANSVNGFEIATAGDGANAALAVISVGSVPTLHNVSLATGAATAAGAISGLNPGETIRGLAVAPPAAAPTQAPGELLALSETNKLVSFTAGAPQKLCSSTTVTGLQTGESALGIDLRPADGALYALGSTGRLYTVNPMTGATTLKSTLAADAADTTNPFSALDGTDFGVDFNPVPDRLRVVSNTGQNLRINVDNGATTTDATLNPAGSTVTAAAYTNSFAGAGTTTLYVLDVANDRLMIQGQPSGNPNNGDLQAVGTLGMIDVQAATGFDINGRTNAAFAAVTLAGATASELHMLDLASGAATRINAIGGGERVRGLTHATAPQATAFGITGDHRLISFKPTTPGTFDSSTAITGLQGGENVLGMDFRPANGRLYALTDAGRLYTIDATTAVASAAPALTADAADMTNPFTTLAGAAFGVDFNPMADRLRTVSDSEQNLRTNVDSGATTTDATLNRAAFAVTAAAYANNFAGTASTTLYVVDSRNDRLLVQNPPNNGTLNEVGPLGIDVDAINGFEIVGPDTALAAFSTAAAPTSLYAINLASGAATPIGAITLAQASDRITGLSTAPSMTTPAVDSAVFAIVNGRTLICFPRNAPGTLSAAAYLTGLQAGETVLGIDFRPANGLLYALGSTGRIYTIDTATAAATHVSMLAADMADTTEPFSALQGASFGVDFNPVPDRLRVVSDTGQNLRINVDTGATTTDGAINYAAPDAIAAAYTRNFAGTNATSLFVIDVAANTLQLQSPPNDGTLATIGRLDPLQTFGTLGGFDIVGGDDGLALALLQPGGATQSSLYRINLRTGAVTSVGTAGPSGATPLRALALRLQ